MRVWLTMMMMVLASFTPVWAQEDAPWQASVTGQIEAFREGDGAAALGFAGEGFRAQFEGQPEAFNAAIAASGYAAIVQSRSHSFGSFNKLSDTSVLQVVEFVGPDGNYNEAVYQLADEPEEGWRVQGVVLRKAAGLSV